MDPKSTDLLSWDALTSAVAARGSTLDVDAPVTSKNSRALRGRPGFLGCSSVVVDWLFVNFPPFLFGGMLVQYRRVCKARGGGPCGLVVYEKLFMLLEI